MRRSEWICRDGDGYLVSFRGYRPHWSERLGVWLPYYVMEDDVELGLWKERRRLRLDPDGTYTKLKFTDEPVRVDEYDDLDGDARRLAVLIYDSVWTEEDEETFVDKTLSAIRNFLVKRDERMRSEACGMMEDRRYLPSAAEPQVLKEFVRMDDVAALFDHREPPTN